MNRHDATARSHATVVNRAATHAGGDAAQTGPDVSVQVGHENPIETANSVIEEIFTVGLGLASCAQLANGPVAERLAAAVDDLDAIISRVRKAAFRQLSAHDRDPSPLQRRPGPRPAAATRRQPLPVSGADRPRRGADLHLDKCDLARPVRRPCNTE